MDFGAMPVANRFLRREDFPGEKWHPLVVVRCPACTMMQLGPVVSAEELFRNEYPFFTSLSAGMRAHFESMALDILERIRGRDDPFVVELGSNDGTMLRHLAAKGVRHLGVEPAANVAAVARDAGVATISEFFDEELAATLKREHGPAEVIAGANVMCHVTDLPSVAAGIAQLLAEDGVLIFEDPYLGDILEKTAFDQIYDEHVFYFSLASVSAAFAPHGLEVVEVMPQPVHGGSMRYVLARAGRRTASESVEVLRRAESERALGESATWADFRARVDERASGLRSLLEKLRGEGRTVVGYAATSKSTTVINYCGLTHEHLEFISDTTPEKQGRFSPGAHIPIGTPEMFAERQPDHAVLFAWNHREEILRKERGFLERGGKFITFVPDVEVIGGGMEEGGA
jgi:methylation protein EvaC